ncbi:copper transport protein Ctr1p [[Candida] jaroonii]|uniref:Copper transport protein Ctr1p n=1 Tax=[Candida] jaroonii TaxID=467808 RepID=A0ACA9YGE0_9ASCO|nr:copper transport protein Ctr1p [[Candida] jaroonii]
MSLFKRHAGHDHGATSSTEASSTMHMAMDMASSTMDMMMSETSDAMDSMDSTHSMDSDMSMTMYFQKSYKDIPVVFENLKANTGGKAFGIFILLLFLGIATRGLEFLKNYLEQRVWKNENYINHFEPDTESDDKTDGIITQTVNTKKTNIPSSLVKNFIRLVLCFIPEMLGFALMLAAMSFTPIYFFAVVAGLSIGRFVFERLSDRLKLRPVANGFHC